MWRYLLHHSRDGRGNPTPAHIKLLIALRFYATGTFHYVSAELNGYSQSLVCCIVKEVSAAIASQLPQYVTFPTPEKISEVRLAGQKELYSHAIVVRA